MNKSEVEIKNQLKPNKQFYREIEKYIVLNTHINV